MLPTACVADGADPGVCRIGVHHYRERKTGPRFEIAVLQCHTHRRAFTLYPLAHVPYGRVAVAPVSVDGEPALTADAPEPKLAWESTLFAAAIDAAAGCAWAREDARQSALWDTQLEHLDAGAQLLGLAGDLTPAVGDAVAVRLDVARLLHLDATRDYQSAAAGYRQRGRAICAVLEMLRPSPCIVDRLLACGALVGRWGRVVRWDHTESGPGSRVFPPRREAPS